MIDEALEGKQLGDEIKNFFGFKSQDRAAESSNDNSKAAESVAIAESKGEEIVLEDSRSSSTAAETVATE